MGIRARLGVIHEQQQRNHTRTHTTEVRCKERVCTSLHAEMLSSLCCKVTLLEGG